MHANACRELWPIGHCKAVVVPDSPKLVLEAEVNIDFLPSWHVFSDFIDAVSVELSAGPYDAYVADDTQEPKTKAMSQSQIALLLTSREQIVKLSNKAFHYFTVNGC